MDVFKNQNPIERYSRIVSLSELASPSNDYTLNIPRYIDSTEPEDLHDLTAHLNGGIPDRDIDALNDYWRVFPSLRSKLFKNNGRSGYSDALIDSQQLKPMILDHHEFIDFSHRVATIFEAWRNAHNATLKNLKLSNDKTSKQIIDELSEDLLTRFTDIVSATTVKSNCIT